MHQEFSGAVGKPLMNSDPINNVSVEPTLQQQGCNQAGLTKKNKHLIMHTNKC
jgi:hypothetical protein